MTAQKQAKEVTVSVYDQGVEILTELLTPYYANIAKHSYEEQGFEVRITPSC